MQPIPKLADLFTGIINSLNAVFNINIPLTGKSFLRDIGGVWSGKLKTAYNYLANVQKNSNFVTADPPSQGGTLYRFGNIYLLENPKAATQGEYTCAVTGTAGAVLSANTTFLSDPSSLSPNFLFILDTDYVLTGSGDIIMLRATIAGTASNLAIGNTLTAQRPLIGIDQVVTVTGITINAVDAETDEEYRARIQNHVQLEPQGGAPADYIKWGSDAAGVARIYPYTPGGTPWQVNVYVEAILSDSGGSAPDYNYGIPTGTILMDVTNAILTDPVTALVRKPMGVVLGAANVGALAVTVYQVVITFTGSTGISADDQASIIAALQQAIADIRPFIAGAEVVQEQNDTLSINLPATGGRTAAPEKYVVVVIAMQAAPGALFTGVSMTVNAISETSFTFDNGIIPYLKAVNVLFT